VKPEILLNHFPLVHILRKRKQLIEQQVQHEIQAHNGIMIIDLGLHDLFNTSYHYIIDFLSKFLFIIIFI
jgi:UDP-galactopyranose mutase